MTFITNKKATSTVSMGEDINFPFIFIEKEHKKTRLAVKVIANPQIAVSGTKHTVTTDKN